MGNDRIRKIGRDHYRLAVLRVEERDEHGRVEVCTVIPEGRVAELSDDPEKNDFVTAWINVGGYAR